MNTAYIALGSNLGTASASPHAQLQLAVQHIHQLADCEVITCSPVYQSPAHETVDAQPDYLNAVIRITTTLDAESLLHTLAHIERSHGRVREHASVRNAARTLDLDLLLFNDDTLASESLTVPHPRMHVRAFVLRPLLDIAPEIAIPGLGKAATFLPGVSMQTLTRFSEPLPWI